MYSLYTDGGSRGNPGYAAIGYLCFDENKKLVFKGKEFIGVATNNFAEYTALIKGLKICINRGVQNLSCFMDSELVVKQLSREYKVKNENIKPLFDQVLNLVKQFSNIGFNYIPRKENKEADKLVNEALDERLDKKNSVL